MTTTPPVQRKKLFPLDIDAQAKMINEFAVEHHVPTMVFADSTEKPEPATIVTLSAKPERKARALPKSSVLHRVAVDLPQHLIDQIETKAFKTKKTKRFIITQALKDAGFHVEDHELIEDGRRGQ